MHTIHSHRRAILLLACLFSLTTYVRADIFFRWPNDKNVIPGTEDIVLGPGVDLSGWNNESRNLRQADLSRKRLTGANFRGSWLDSAVLNESYLLDADLSSTQLTNASLAGSRVAGANLTDANVVGVTFSNAVGLTPDQLYSTQSYRARDLRGIRLGNNDLTGWNFREQDLTGADFTRADLTDADLTNSIVRGASFAGAFAGAVGFTSEQLYSTRSYQAQDLRGIDLAFHALTGTDFREQDLTGADFYSADLTNADLTGANLTNVSFGTTLTGANLTGAVVTGTRFYGERFTGFLVATSGHRNTGFSPDQLYSTLNYQEKDLSGTGYAGDLSGWDFNGQYLAGANFNAADLTGANLAGADLTNAHSSWGSTFSNADLTGANLKNANLRDAVDLESSLFTSNTIYNQWTQFPEGFDPVAAGMTFEASLIGDFDANGVLDREDYNLLSQTIFNAGFWWLHDLYDLNGDETIDESDLTRWIIDVKQAGPGDANLDGEFNSGDLVEAFQAGKYETHEVAVWSEGDWNADKRFDSSDLVVAFQGGAFEMGNRVAVSAAPEPSSLALLMLGLLGIGRIRRTSIAGLPGKSCIDWETEP